MRKPLSFLTAAILAATLLIAGGTVATAAQAPPKDPFIAKVLEATNKYRAANDAPAVFFNATISKGSQSWAKEVDSRINGNKLDMSRIHRPDAGLSILPKGQDMYSEVIGINNTAQQVVDWWMDSPSHRAALLNKRATDMGIGQVRTTKVGYASMTVAVANFAGYEANRKKQPQPKPVPPAAAGDIAAIDSAGSLYIYPSARGNDMRNRKYLGWGWGNALQISLSDHNSDGIADLVARWKSGKLSVSYGRADGTFDPLIIIGTSGWEPYEIISAKWKNNDKYPGVIAQNTISGQLFYYPNSTGQSLGTRTQIGSGFRKSFALVSVDFDRDGNQDILLRNDAAQLMLYRGTGTGSFTSEARRVVGNGWGAMTHLSGIYKHLGTDSYGVLARTPDGALLHYPLLTNGWGGKTQVGSSGWAPMLLGS